MRFQVMIYSPLHTLYLQKIIAPVDGQGTCQPPPPSISTSPLLEMMTDPACGWSLWAATASKALGIEEGFWMSGELSWHLSYFR